MSEPLLFDLLPALRNHAPRIELTELPTPVEPLKELGRAVGHDGLWIKRDDLSAPFYGGNKPRKLEFLLGEAKERGAEEVVTAGGLGTNHGLATAYYAKRLGLKVRLLLFPQPVTSEVEKKLRLFGELGAEVARVASIREAGREVVRLHAAAQNRVYFIAPGGSSPLGNLGFVNAGLELAAQVRQGLLPCPAAIFLPFGSMGTAAGLALGLALANLPIPITAIRVVGLPFANRLSFQVLFNASERLLLTGGGTKSRIKPVPVYIRGGFYGRGYGRETESGRRALALIQETEGLTLDLTYSAKAFAGMLQDIKTSRLSRRDVLFWHTYNSRDLNRLTD